MSFARTLTFAGLATSVLATIVVAQGCSSSSSPAEETTMDGGSKSSGSGKSSGTTSSTPDSGSVTTSGSSGSATGIPSGANAVPPAPSGSPTKSTATHNFAIHNLYLGDDTPYLATGVVSPTAADYPPSVGNVAWETIGYNLDGLDSTSTSTNVCTPSGSSKLQQVDGVGGIDNAFGHIIVAGLADLGMNLSQVVSEKIASGSFTIEIDTTGLDATQATATGSTQTATALGGQLFAGDDYDGMTAPPLTGAYFSKTDNWPVASELLNGTTVASGSKIKFPSSYVSNGTWVSGSPTSIDVSISFAGVVLNLTIASALMTFDYSVDASGQGHATKGIIAGALNTQQFLSALNSVLGGIDNGSYCSEAQSLLLPIITGAQDVIVDGNTVTNKAGTACNGISIGIAFDADEIAAPSVVAPKGDAGTAKPCPAAGG